MSKKSFSTSINSNPIVNVLLNLGESPVVSVSITNLFIKYEILNRVYMDCCVISQSLLTSLSLVFYVEGVPFALVLS